MVASGERHRPRRAVPARPSTSTRPAAWATRSRWSSRPSSPPAAPPCRSSPGAASATPAGRSTSSRRSPGWRSDLSNDEIVGQLETVGCVICAAGDGLAPADRKLYALRDVTATVESIPLIAASIMSKKIAEGTASLVLDVKVGSGAFMTDRDRAALLARTMVGLGGDHGVDVRAAHRHGRARLAVPPATRSR